MTNKSNIIIGLIIFSSFIACSLNHQANEDGNDSKADESINKIAQEQKPHRYGGWYCPDNLRGFPAVNIAEWDKVPVVNGRMPTKEETENGISLIYVDKAAYPNAKPLAMKMPRLARIYNPNANREDIIILIQAVNINQDSIVGYRFLNGGNGSARLNEITFISDQEISDMKPTQFIAESIEINASQTQIADVLSNPQFNEFLVPIYDQNNILKKNWRASANVNFTYLNAGKPTSLYANNLFGNYYVQNDFTENLYTEKFIVIANQETQNCTLTLTCGPFADDFEDQKAVLSAWIHKVKELSEQ